MNNSSQDHFPLNAIATLTVSGIAHSADDQADRPLLMLRKEVPILQPYQHPPELWSESEMRPEGHPQRLPSQLPPKGNCHIKFSLESLPQTTRYAGMGVPRGRCGLVYAVAVTSWSTAVNDAPHDPSELIGRLPPLVVKVARKGHISELIHEASFYEEMEHLQGVSIPRCYGLFEAYMEDDWEMVSMEGDYSDSDEEDVTLTPLGPEHEGLSADERDDLLNKKFEEALRKQQLERERRRPQEPNTVTLLLLERLAGTPPMFVELGAEVRSDILALYEDLAECGIFYEDIRAWNILEAPASPPGFPGAICSYHGRSHQWRIIDFSHYIRKVAYTSEFMNAEYKCCLSQVLNFLVVGIIYGGGE
ncbi:hypothetical protein A0H81_14939 [Grifola frondosa]|uniref:Protein kinase domain-containing protein n=1 Tax=Grifola frondosa TaxID=5627 RepID=A0A1C7LK17_GRIFR|nr:hypothetical protein A0H81_14939 [Grifola frondosa]